MIVRKTIRLRSKFSLLDNVAPILLLLVLVPYLMTILYDHMEIQALDIPTSPLATPLRLFQPGPQNTTCKDWPLEKAQNHPRYKSLLEKITLSLQNHLYSQQYACLCMHHLEPLAKTQFRVCATYLRGTQETLLLINPVPKAVSEERYMYKEQTLACGNTTVLTRERAKTFLMDWFTSKGQRLSGAFYGARAACFQLVLEEMEGNMDCNKK